MANTTALSLYETAEKNGYEICDSCQDIFDPEEITEYRSMKLCPNCLRAMRELNGENEKVADIPAADYIIPFLDKNKTYSYTPYVPPERHLKNTGIPTNKEFQKICQMSKDRLKGYLVYKLRTMYSDVVVRDGYILAKGSVPVLLTAHMDTVHKKAPDVIETSVNAEGKTEVTSETGIGGDDRCGIYMILRIIEQQKCSVLFCEDEEIGCVGSRKFCKQEKLNDALKGDINYIIELDRKGNSDIVFYSNDNPDFTKYIQDNMPGFTKATGSCSDISELMPTLNRSGVNFSCGYYKPHTDSEYVIMEDMDNTISKVIQLVGKHVESPYEYVEKKYPSYNRGSSYYYDYEDDDWYGYNYNGYSKTNPHALSPEPIDDAPQGEDYDAETPPDPNALNFFLSSPLVLKQGETLRGEFEYSDFYGDFLTETVEGKTKQEILARFFLLHPSISYEMVEYWEINIISPSGEASVVMTSEYERITSVIQQKERGKGGGKNDNKGTPAEVHEESH